MAVWVAVMDTAHKEKDPALERRRLVIEELRAKNPDIDQFSAEKLYDEYNAPKNVGKQTDEHIHR